MALTGATDPSLVGASELSDSSSLVEAVVGSLVARDVLTPQALTRGRRAAEQQGERLDIVLNKLGLASDDALATAWASIVDLPIIGPLDYPPEPVLPDMLGSTFLANARTLPLRVREDTLDLAVVDPLDRFTPAAIAAKTGLKVARRLARPGEFTAAFERLYTNAQATLADADVLLGTDAALTGDVERLRDLASDAPVIRVVNGLVDRAIELGASDLHIAATRTGLRVRYRLDGVLREVDPPPLQFHAAIISRLKIMAGLDIAERRLPQDGRIRIAWRGREIDLRIATAPHANGEGAVLRVLDRSAVRLDFAALGFSPSLVKTLTAILAEPHGIFLVTGPTGSGKTTTLYAALRAITTPERNVITVEDPVEYQLDGVNQIQVNRKIGLDFASALRSILRQDPDIIMVGEIRDGETAAVANQAALTGHLVLATVHTNTAVAALPRLVDMGVEPYLLASTVRGTMAQRLVRRLCPVCRREVGLEDWQRRLWQRQADAPRTCYEPVGCHACKGTGYAGRVAVAEVMPMVPALRTKLLEKADEADLAQTARAAGMATLMDDGLGKVAAGLTSVTELLRVIGSG
jgi:general secretion pathway protein E